MFHQKCLEFFFTLLEKAQFITCFLNVIRYLLKSHQFVRGETLNNGPVPNASLLLKQVHDLVCEVTPFLVSVGHVNAPPFCIFCLKEQQHCACALRAVTSHERARKTPSSGISGLIYFMVNK